MILDFFYLFFYMVLVAFGGKRIQAKAEKNDYDAGGGNDW